MTETLEQKADRLGSDLAIKELRSKYCWYAARGMAEPIVEMFTEDCRFENTDFNSQPVVSLGRVALLKNLQAIAKPGLVTPLIVNHIININGDTATGTCAMESASSPLPGAPILVCFYYDTFKRIDGKWFFASRDLRYYRPRHEVKPNETRGPDGRVAA
jgi:hypothetical protein